MTARVKLTVKRVEDALAPASGEAFLHDADVPGLALRVRARGGKSWVFTYRTEGGRAGVVRRVRLGAYPRVGLDDARREAKQLAGEVAKGRDPIAEQKAEEERLAAAGAARAARLSLRAALDAYDADLARRAVRDRRNVLSALRRRLLGDDATDQGARPFALGDLPLVDLDRAAVMRIVAAIEAAGEPGAARSLRQKATTFLNWATDQGHISANPLAGMRRQRATRAERVEKRGRMLADAELAVLWRACVASAAGPAPGLRALASIVRVLILTGQRRTETARMRWADLDDDRAWWTIPAAEAKNGVAHAVPLPPAVRAVIEAQPVHAGCPWVFTTDGASPVSGWSKLEPKLRAAAANAGLDGPWTLHDLRRSFRSGLTRLRIDSELAEIMLNHRPEQLRAVYDLEPRRDERAAAAERWTLHVLGAAGEPEAAKIIKLKKGAAA